jgi:hypothetical protein
VARNSGKRLAAGLALIICAGAAGVVANRGVASVAAPHHEAAPPASPTNASTAWPAGAYAIGTQVRLATKGAEAAPHGGIGEPAFAQRP